MMSNLIDNCEDKGMKLSLVKTNVMMSMILQINMKPSCTIDPCGICGNRTMVNAVLCKSKCRNFKRNKCTGCYLDVKE